MNYTGDYAVVDKDGCLTVLDRYSDPITIKVNGKTEEVNKLDIVEKIKTNRNIKNCKMTFNNEKLVLHLSLDDFYNITDEEKIESILSTIKENLEPKYYPNIINVLEDLPRTQVGKVDYKTLEKMGNELTIDLDENTKLIIKKEEQKTKKIKRK